MSATAFTRGTMPTVAVEIASDAVSAAAIDLRRGSPTLLACATEPLPPGALVPSLTAANVKDRAAVAGALTRVLERVGRPRRIGLVVPDLIAKVSLVRFQQVPSRRQDLEQLVHWQVRKAAPFPIEEAQISFVPTARHSDGQEFFVSVARRDIVTEYEELCASAGAHAGLVDLATVNVVNAVLAGSKRPSGDWLLVNMAADWASIAIVRGADVILFRSRSADGEGTLPDLVHQTAMYYEDRLSGSGFGGVLLSGLHGDARTTSEVATLQTTLATRLNTAVNWIDLRSTVSLGDRLDASSALLDRAVPLVGLLVRGEEAAA